MTANVGNSGTVDVGVEVGVGVGEVDVEMELAGTVIVCVSP